MKAKSTATNPKSGETKPKEFVLVRPWLWLMVVCLILYIPSLEFGFTELDDSIFIRELSAYNEDLSNLFTSFRRGVFHATNDTYYRPLFLDSIILNYQASEQDISGYRLVNIILHILSVVFLFRLLRTLNLSDITAFGLTLIFAVHPALTQAVVWIPGRNDTLMAVFIFPFLQQAILYAREGKIQQLLISAGCLLAAVFTKETALLAPAVAFILLVVMLGKKWNERNLLIQYGLWTATVSIFLLARSAASLKQQGLNPLQMLTDFMKRLPLVVQYLGKLILPFNLSVFPIQQDTVLYFGLVAIVLIIVLLLTAKEKNGRMILGGVLIYFAFLLPALLVPRTLNEQAFEHRLYLPFAGILIVLSQSVLFRNKLSARTQVLLIAGIACLFAVLNYRHQQHFRDPLSFWQQAARTSPHSAYALMMYGARHESKDTGYALMRRAYQLNPNEKYLNYYYGVMLQNQDSVLESEKHFLKEQEISDYFECDFYLAQIDYKKGDKQNAQRHLERYLTRDSMNAPANNNLLLLYLESGQGANALQHIRNMQRRGLAVPPALIQQAEGMR